LWLSGYQFEAIGLCKDYGKEAESPQAEKKAIKAVPGLPQKAGKVILPPILLKKNESNNL